MRKPKKDVAVVALKDSNDDYYIIPKEWVEKCKVPLDEKTAVQEAISSTAAVKYETLAAGSPVSVVF